MEWAGAAVVVAVVCALATKGIFFVKREEETLSAPQADLMPAINSVSITVPCLGSAHDSGCTHSCCHSQRALCFLYARSLIRRHRYRSSTPSPATGKPPALPQWRSTRRAPAARGASNVNSPSHPVLTAQAAREPTCTACPATTAALPPTQLIYHASRVVAAIFCAAYPPSPWTLVFRKANGMDLASPVRQLTEARGQSRNAVMGSSTPIPVAPLPPPPSPQQSSSPPSPWVLTSH
ncbi:hypothetical protein AcW2_007701 [Taiwanofungus camphoratus]|nr:hypothetical protein AcW2_007701 [Antrodia cinnamomea]